MAGLKPKLEIERILLSPLSDAQLEALLNYAETGQLIWSVRTMTRAEFEKQYSLKPAQKCEPSSGE